LVISNFIFRNSMLRFIQVLVEIFITVKFNLIIWVKY